MPASWKRLCVRLALVGFSLSLITACATGPDPRDPFEPFNRGVYSFNEGLDRTILQPVARGYRAVLPQFIRSSVSNFFSNINDIVVALNNLLQGKFTAAYTDLGRVAINSTIGILGLFDVASEAGIEKHDEDFGQTLGRWGMGDGPFVMLPLFGPSTGRDTVGRIGDYFSDPMTYVDPSRSRNQLVGTRLVNRRAELLDASTVLQTAALDPYEFVRDAYLQRRRHLIYDGSPPRDREFLDPPPKQGAAPRTPTYPAAAEPTGYGAILVSGEALTPVQSTYSQPAAVAVRPQASAAASARSNVIAVRTDGSPVVIGEPLSAVQLEALPPGHLTVAGAAPAPQTALPRLREVLKTLQLTH
jgi:phospholipid-binding lipoprotein MlaA